MQKMSKLFLLFLSVVPFLDIMLFTAGIAFCIAGKMQSR